MKTLGKPFVFLMLIAAIVIPSSVALAGGGPPPDPTTPPIIVTSLRAVNDPDSAVGGGAWALDNDWRYIKAWLSGDDEEGLTLYTHVRYGGTFNSFAGTSPNGTGTIPAGVTGVMSGDYIYIVHGDGWLEDHAPFIGSLGTFDYQGDQAGNAPGAKFWAAFFLENPEFVDSIYWNFCYDAGQNGWAVQNQYGYFGDITGEPLVGSPCPQPVPAKFNPWRGYQLHKFVNADPARPKILKPVFWIHTDPEEQAPNEASVLANCNSAKNLDTAEADVKAYSCQAKFITEIRDIHVEGNLLDGSVRSDDPEWPLSAYNPAWAH